MTTNVVTFEHMGVRITIGPNDDTGEPSVFVDTEVRDKPTRREVPDVAVYLNDASLYDGQADAKKGK